MANTNHIQWHLWRLTVYNIFSGLFFNLPCIYIVISHFVFLWDFCVCESVCVYIFVSWAFSLALFSLISLFLLYLVLFYYYFLDACLYTTERKGRDLDKWGSRRGETIITIHSIFKNFQLKKRKKSLSIQNREQCILIFYDTVYILQPKPTHF